MLTQTFLHLAGIGKSSEAKLQASGLRCWEDALAAEQIPLKGTSRAIFLAGLQESKRRLAAGDALWFSERLPSSEQWRLYPHFHAEAAYVDIETTGLSWPSGQITCIALYDRQQIKMYVQGHNLEDFASDIENYKLLITWNGRAFDAPWLRRSFGLKLKMAHLDLLPVFRALGIRGGLKKVEKELGLDRQALDGVNGYMAILLWNEYCQTGQASALETLLAYNAEDVLSLDTLCRHACLCHGLHPDLLDRPNPPPLNPFRPDSELLTRLKSFTR